MRNSEIDKILSIIDNLFGEDDGSSVPQPMDMRGSGLGDEHCMERPVHTCEQMFEPLQVVPEDAILDELFEKLADICEDGRETSALYDDDDETKQPALEQISAEHARVTALIDARLAELS